MILIAGYPIDCVDVEEHAYENEVTDHPVETGSDIADHVRARPIVVTLNGVVSDTPIGLIASDDSRVRSAKPSADALALFDKIRRDREPITIVTSLRTYENMILERVTIPRDVSDGDSLRFGATFRQVALVTNERTVIRTADPRGNKKQDFGSLATKSFITRAVFAARSGNISGFFAPKIAPKIDRRRDPIRSVRSTTNSLGNVPGGRVFVGP